MQRPDEKPESRVTAMLRVTGVIASDCEVVRIGSVAEADYDIGLRFIQNAMNGATRKFRFWFQGELDSMSP